MTDPAAIELVAVEDAGDDVLQVRGRVDGVDYTATGWVSATTNHYDPDAYKWVTFDDDGNAHDAAEGDAGATLARLDDAKPRAMSAAEVGDYARRLILEQHPELAGAPAAPGPEPSRAIAFE